MAETTRVLPADVYDTLELSALAFGGIGGGRYWQRVEFVASAPYCALGHAWAVADTATSSEEVADALQAAGIREETNDAAVAQINARLKKPRKARISFKQWCKELAVVRGA